MYFKTGFWQIEKGQQKKQEKLLEHGNNKNFCRMFMISYFLYWIWQIKQLTCKKY